MKRNDPIFIPAAFNLGGQWEPAQPLPTDEPWIIYATIDRGAERLARLIQPWTDELSEVERCQ